MVFGLGLVHLAHDTDDTARDGEILALVDDDGAVFRVGGAQFDMVGKRLVIFVSCLVVYLCHDDFTAFCSLLLTCEDEVAVENACIDHGIALDAEREDVGAAGEEIAVDGDRTFEVLDCKDGRTGGDSANDGDFDGVARCRFGCGTVGVDNLDTAAEPRGSVEVALLDEGGQDGTDAVCRRNFKVVADFTDRRRHAVFLGVLLDVLVDFLLTGRQFFALAVAFHIDLAMAWCLPT